MTFEAIFRAHLDFVWRVARREVGDEGADDVAQETFLIVRRRLPEFSGAAVQGWLYRITVNVARNHRRRRHRQHRAVANAPVPSGPLGPDDVLARDEAVELMERFVATLRPKQREAFVLHVLEGVPAREVAAALGIPTRTVYSRARAARAALSSFVEATQTEPEAVG